jgi:aspartate/tyrosine/aromatic aminotransferase
MTQSLLCVCGPFTGVADFVSLAEEFALGKDSPALKQKRVASVQVRRGSSVE